MSKRTTLAAAIGAFAVVGLPCGLVSAHNAGNLEKQDGSCLDVGSDRDAPIVGENNPNINRTGDTTNLDNQLDLIPTSDGDQYGARFAADRSPRLEGGNC